MTTDEAGKVIVARIIIDSVIERQGLLRPGDLILEANNTRVKTPEQLQNLIEQSPEFITLKIQPTLSVSQSQPLNPVEKSSTAVPNKVTHSSDHLLQIVSFITVRSLLSEGRTHSIVQKRENAYCCTVKSSLHTKKLKI